MKGKIHFFAQGMFLVFACAPIACSDPNAPDTTPITPVEVEGE